MKFIIALFALAYAIEFQSHTSCTGYDAACTGTTGDATTCLGQDTYIKAAMLAEGHDITAMATTWTAAAAQALMRYAYQTNWDNNGVFEPQIDLGTIYRCTLEANSLVYSQTSSCLNEWGSCIADQTTTGCANDWDTIVNNTKYLTGSLGLPMTFTYIQEGVQAIGAIPFTLLGDATAMTAYSATQLAILNAAADMQNNGKIMGMMSCMLYNWGGGIDAMTVYPSLPCFDVAVACANDADCITASTNVAQCANDNDIATEPNALLPVLSAPLATASHDDWCTVAGCASEEGNILFMSVGTCLMENAGFAFKKCYDDMVVQLFTMFMIIGGGAFVGSILIFTTGWCLCCRNKNKVETAV